MKGKHQQLADRRRLREESALVQEMRQIIDELNVRAADAAQLPALRQALATAERNVAEITGPELERLRQASSERQEYLEQLLKDLCHDTSKLLGKVMLQPGEDSIIPARLINRKEYRDFGLVIESSNRTQRRAMTSKITDGDRGIV
jgi:hypothetical protein